MILTIASQEAAAIPAGSAPSSATTAGSIARSLASRRANAGRNVLLICQKTPDKQPNQHRKGNDDCAWLATDMKAGARGRKLAVEEIADELASARERYHDVVIDMPRLQHEDSLYVLAATGLAVFAIQTASWNQDRQKRLIQRISAARSWNPALPVLVIVDDVDSLAAQAIISRLSDKVAHIRFIHLHVAQQHGLAANDAPLTALYKAIYKC